MKIKRYIYPLLLICSLATAHARPITEARQALYQGHHEQAMLHWQAVLNANPTPEIWQESVLNIARIYHHIGIYAQALATLNTALAGDDKAYQALLTKELSKVRISQGDKGTEQAKELSKQAVAMAR